MKSIKTTNNSGYSISAQLVLIASYFIINDVIFILVGIKVITKLESYITVERVIQAMR